MQKGGRKTEELTAERRARGKHLYTRGGEIARFGKRGKGGGGWKRRDYRGKGGS